MITVVFHGGSIVGWSSNWGTDPGYLGALSMLLGSKAAKGKTRAPSTFWWEVSLVKT